MKTKRIMVCLISSAILFGSTTYFPVIENSNDIINTAYATSKTADEAIEWVKSQVGKSIDYDGAYGAQCVDLILAYYNYLGAPTSTGNACDYTWNTLPDGWQRLEGVEPQKGDILVYTDSSYGHVGLYESERSHYHQNISYNGVAHQWVENITWAYNGFDSKYWGVIRPNWADTKVIGHEMAESEAAGQTLPDGDYCISSILSNNFFIDPAPGADVPGEIGANVTLYNFDYKMPPSWDSWTLTYLNNGFYKITQKDTNMCLDVKGASMYSGTDVILYPYHEDSAQMWSIQKNDNGYSIQSKCNGFYLDIGRWNGENLAYMCVDEESATSSHLFDFVPSNENIFEKSLSGDANNDGVIDLKDVVIIRRYVAGGWDVEIDTANADVNADDIVDLKDVVLTRRYIAGGWDVELK